MQGTAQLLFWYQGQSPTEWGGRIVAMLLSFTLSRRTLPRPEGRWNPTVGVCLGPCDSPTADERGNCPDRRDECFSIESWRLPLPWYTLGGAEMTFLSTMYLLWYRIGFDKTIGHLGELAYGRYVLTVPCVPTWEASGELLFFHGNKLS